MSDANDTVNAAASTSSTQQSARDIIATSATIIEASAGDDAVVDTNRRIQLTEAEQRKKDEIVAKLDLTRTHDVLQYGSGLQQRMTAFSDQALESVRTKDFDEVGGLVVGLVTRLRGFEVTEEKKGLARLFAKAGNSIVTLKARYDDMEKNVDKISKALDGHRLALLKDIELLDRLYAQNLDYIHNLNIYLVAGTQKLAQAQEQELPALQTKAQASGQEADAQAAKNLADMINRFEKRLYDLELTRTISLQMAPQIKMVQHNDALMAEKIQTSLNNTIPLWKNQMVLALGLSHSAAAIRAQREVTEATNELLRKNADTLKQSTIDAARESERGIVDIETLNHTNEQLISTLDEVKAIQEAGQRDRAEAQLALIEIENQLKAKLLEVAGGTSGERPPVQKTLPEITHPATLTPAASDLLLG
ncbi:MAG: toxic anion resistance protein [Coriobacteriales bacterium]|jgi:uncharacterized protein YaaN involved in tellurite resistance|nr:toxic anion resistance protein [Coriobacteriales bacterium]